MLLFFRLPSLTVVILASLVGVFIGCGMTVEHDVPLSIRILGVVIAGLSGWVCFVSLRWFCRMVKAFFS